MSKGWLNSYVLQLTPVDEDTFQLALESWAIWRRWETAFHQGQVSNDTHPALPVERARSEELDRLLAMRLIMPPDTVIRKSAAFRKRNDPLWSGYGFSSLEVEWSGGV